MNVLKEYILVAITQSVWINPEALLVCARLGMLGTHLKNALVSITLLLLLLLLLFLLLLLLLLLLW